MSGDELRERLSEISEELGRARAIAERVESLAVERDELVQQLAEARAALDNKIAEEVRSATAALRQQYDQASAQWTAEREELKARITELEKRPQPGRISGDVSTDALAEHFRGVLETLASPAPTAGRPYSAALTGLEVEARGVLAASEGDEPVRLVPVDPEVAAKGDLNLSTVRMRFGLMPEIAPERRES